MIDRKVVIVDIITLDISEDVSGSKISPSSTIWEILWYECIQTRVIILKISFVISKPLFHKEIWWQLKMQIFAVTIVRIKYIQQSTYYPDADYPNCPIIRINQMYYCAFFPGIFQKFSCKILSFSADSLKEVEKMLLFLFKNTVLKN